MSTTADGFIKRIARLQADVVEQGRRVQSMLEAALDSLFDHHPERAQGIMAQDDVIDSADVEIERASVALLTDAVSQNASLEAKQLRTVLTIVKVNNEMERIADVASDIAELSGTMAAAVKGAQLPDTFRVMANSVIGILRDVCTALMRNDAALANIVLQSQHAVTAFKSAILRDSEEKIAKGTMAVDVGFSLHEIASQCELIADHCTNIAEQVIYLNTGAIVRHTQTSWVELPRPKTG